MSTKRAAKTKKKASKTGARAATKKTGSGRRNGYQSLKFDGYRRENGRVGIRNHVVIPPLDDQKRL